MNEFVANEAGIMKYVEQIEQDEYDVGHEGMQGPSSINKPFIFGQTKPSYITENNDNDISVLLRNMNGNSNSKLHNQLKTLIEEIVETRIH